MKKLSYFIFIGLILSCSLNKDILTQYWKYELIIQDIKEDSRFIEFKDQYQNKCDNFNVYSKNISICDFYIHEFLEIESLDIVKIYKKNCTNGNYYEYKQLLDEDLDKYSDKADQCFNIWFSGEINKKIIVQIIAIESSDQFGYEVLNYIYELKEGKVQKLDTFGATVN